MTLPYRYARPLTSEPSLDPPDPPREPEEPQPRAVKPTPGPWTYAAHTTSQGWTSEFAIHAPCWREMAIVFVQDEDQYGDSLLGSGEANARLMAAAPDLLAALEGVALRNGEDGPCFCAVRVSPHHLSCLRARAAIAKAKGGAA